MQATPSAYYARECPVDKGLPWQRARENVGISLRRRFRGELTVTALIYVVHDTFWVDFFLMMGF